MEYLTRDSVYVFILLMRFLPLSLISRSFRILQRNSFLIFFFSFPFVWWRPLPITPNACNSPLKTNWCFPDLVVLFFPLCLLSLLLIMSMEHFSMSNSISVSWLYIILFVSGSPVLLRLLIIIIFIPLCEFFTSALTSGLSLESEWQHVSPGLQDSFQYSRRS